MLLESGGYEALIGRVADGPVSTCPNWISAYRDWRASRRRHSLEEELGRILDEAARAEAGNPDANEPLGSFIVRITRPGYEDVAAAIDAQRRRPDRALPVFE